MDLGIQALEASSNVCATPDIQHEIESLTVTSDKHAGTHYQNHDNLVPHSSFSTLPSTMSKMALKPSPLRFVKGSQLDNAPPIPVRSPLRTVRNGNENDTSYPVRSSSLLALSSPCCRSSYYTMSVYSVDSDGDHVGPNDTPPSSPPQTPQHQKRQSSLVEVDAYTRAEGLRNELGIIDDIYDMYADTNRDPKHEACIGGIDRGISFLELPQKVASEGLSRTQRRLQKARAREEAARMLEGSKTEVKRHETDFEQWLHRNSQPKAYEDSHRISSLNSYTQHPLMLTSLSQKFRVSSVNLSDIAEECERRAGMTYVHSDEKTKHTGDKYEVLTATSLLPQTLIEDEVNLTDFPLPPTAELRTEFRPSLAILQERLQALMRDDTRSSHDHTHPATPKIPDQPVISPSPSFVSPSTTTDEAEHESWGLQRIEIEWRGRRFPVVIGDGGKIWEGPCTDAYCKEHGGPRKELAYGMF